MKKSRLRRIFAIAFAALIASTAIAEAQNAGSAKNAIKATVATVEQTHRRKPVIDRTFGKRWLKQLRWNCSTKQTWKGLLLPGLAFNLGGIVNPELGLDGLIGS